MDVIWSFFNMVGEKIFKFNVSVFNEILDVKWFFVNLVYGKSLKFNV